MKKSSAVFLQVVVVFIGVGALAFLLWEPHVEGRNAEATPFEVYFHDPFLAYAYASSIAFFLGLYHAFKVLGHAGRDRVFSPGVVRSLRTIEYCALALIGLVIVGEAVFILPYGDGPEGLMMGLFVMGAAAVVAAASAMAARVLESGVVMKSEHELTV